jgi:hypothetical protein
MRLTVYGLADPLEPQDIRYVGLTRQALKRRLAQHCAQSADLASNPAKATWILRLKKERRRPIIVPLLKVREVHAYEAERDMKRRLIAAGHKLFANADLPGTHKKSYYLTGRADTRARNILWRARVRADPKLHAEYLEKAYARKRRRIANNLPKGHRQ